MMLHLASKGFERSRAKGELMSGRGAGNGLRTQEPPDRRRGAVTVHPPGLVHYQNNCVLNISRSRPMPPSPKLDSGPEDFRASGSSFIRYSQIANSHWITLGLVETIL